MELGSKISQYLKEHNLKQRDFAKEMGMSENAISKIVNGRTPSLDFIIKWSKIDPTIDLNYMIKTDGYSKTAHENMHVSEDDSTRFLKADKIKNNIDIIKDAIGQIEELTQK